VTTSPRRTGLVGSTFAAVLTRHAASFRAASTPLRNLIVLRRGPFPFAVLAGPLHMHDLILDGGRGLDTTGL